MPSCLPILKTKVSLNVSVRTSLSVLDHAPLYKPLTVGTVPNFHGIAEFPSRRFTPYLTSNQHLSMLRVTRNDPQKSRCIVSYASNPSAAWHPQPQYGRNSWDQGLTGGTLHPKREKDTEVFGSSSSNGGNLILLKCLLSLGSSNLELPQ